MAARNPHSLRKTLSQLGERICRTPEEFKAWSQNLGHENVLTTFTSYGEVSLHRQAELLKGLNDPAGSCHDQSAPGDRAALLLAFGEFLRKDT